MRSIDSLIKHLRVDYSQFSFELSDKFFWSAKKQTVYFDQTDENSEAFCLHELSHALLGHQGYERDMELIKMERDAWEYAMTELAPLYAITIDDEIVQGNLDTYREWLHARSTCPMCEATGIQTKQQYYSCLACGQTWRANEARLCALRRYSVQTK